MLKRNSMASKKGVIPDRIPLQLVNLVGRPPPGEWLYEIKLDAYRLMARLDGPVALITQNGHDWTSRMPTLAQGLARLPVRGAWVDGEIVMLDGEGRPAFQPLQAAFSQRKPMPPKALAGSFTTRGTSKCFDCSDQDSVVGAVTWFPGAAYRLGEDPHQQRVDSARAHIPE